MYWFLPPFPALSSCIYTTWFWDQWRLLFLNNTQYNQFLSNFYCLSISFWFSRKLLLFRKLFLLNRLIERHFCQYMDTCIFITFWSATWKVSTVTFSTNKFNVISMFQLNCTFYYLRRNKIDSLYLKIRSVRLNGSFYENNNNNFIP